jgi:lipopolysaccharide/colanic/teichoic acid biosynthesis glycosyltransferase
MQSLALRPPGPAAGPADRAALTKAQRWALADRLAADRLWLVNAGAAVPRPRRGLYAGVGKRAVDIVVALIVLTLTWPLNAVMALVTLATVGRPLLFHQERLGRDGRPFTIVKFRSMRELRDARGELLGEEARVTAFGRFIRRTSLDELLSFWQVLTGRMSLIGPRPLVPEYLGRYSDRHRARLSVRPGLECPPRRLESRERTWQDQFEDDVWYVEHVSAKTDLWAFWQLVRYTFVRGQVSTGGVSARGTFMGYGLDGQAINLDQVPQVYVDEVVREAALAPLGRGEAPCELPGPAASSSSAPTPAPPRSLPARAAAVPVPA